MEKSVRRSDDRDRETEEKKQHGGPMMDKAADAVIDSMGKTWQSMLQQAGTEQELREKIAKIWS